MLHDVVQRKKFYTLVLQKCLTRSVGQESYQFMFIDNQIAVASLDFSQEQYEYFLADVEDLETNPYYIDSRWAELFSRTSLA